MYHEGQRPVKSAGQRFGRAQKFNILKCSVSFKVAFSVYKLKSGVETVQNSPILSNDNRNYLYFSADQDYH